ncbi:lipase 3-like [Arctopsyche grandis]|uniref:lipase 3-like n=1 Tax=Arctopsyche grandis TaxID=121162 RepID=UPI00406D6D11
MFKFRSLVLILCLLCTSVNPNGSPHMIEYFSTLTINEISRIPKSIIEDSILDSSRLIEKYGYPVETHETETEDGYLVTMHRIPRGKHDTNDEKKRIPVLIMHGLFCSSAVWILNGPEKSLGFILADQGFDVWLGNARGNFYSRKHTTLNPDEPKFWKFSWHEIGYYDLPAMIDYILKNTGFSQLHFVGHSQGSTSFFVMGSERPEYNDKIILMQALGPAAYMSHLKSPIFKYLAPFVFTIDTIMSLIGFNEFMPSSELSTVAAHLFCHKDSKFLPLCTNLIFLLCGFNPGQLNVTMLPVYISHIPAGCASRQLAHYAQLYNSGKFRNYDYGSILLNLYMYGSSSPTDYNLTQITAPVAIFFSDNDGMVGLEDVDRLHAELGNPIKKYRLSMTEFSHIDYIWAVDATSILYEHIVKNLKEN